MNITMERHRWGDPVAIVEGTPTGCQETERTCLHCKLVKITIHPPHGDAWREWRHPNGMRVQLDHTPPCRQVKVEVEAVG